METPFELYMGLFNFEFSIKRLVMKLGRYSWSTLRMVNGIMNKKGVYVHNRCK